MRSRAVETADIICTVGSMSHEDEWHCNGSVINGYSKQVIFSFVCTEILFILLCICAARSMWRRVICIQGVSRISSFLGFYGVV